VGLGRAAYLASPFPTFKEYQAEQAGSRVSNHVWSLEEIVGLVD